MTNVRKSPAAARASFWHMDIRHMSPVQWAIVLLAFYMAGSVSIGMRLAELSLRIPARPLDYADAFKARLGQVAQAPVHDAVVTAADGVILRGWFVQPAHANGMSVVLLHGVGDNRIGVSGFAEMFARQGYAVLLPDSREHGQSGGAISTYGVLERDDVHRWVTWMQTRAPGCVYLFGESMGAAIALQATPGTPQLRAVAVESPFATFRRIAYERLAWATHLGVPFWRTAGALPIEVAIAYARLRYGVALLKADPEEAVMHSHVPVLLIAGTADRNILMSNARDLEAHCSDHCSLWIVPGADHEGASIAAPTEFQQRILNWFAQHRDPATQ